MEDKAARVLVVDDEPDLEVLITQRYRREIRDGRYAFSFARNGLEALDLLQEDSATDVLLTDINMPEMDGLTLLRHANEHNPVLESVVVSAYGDMQNIRTAMNRGAFDFVTKPIDFHDLDITLQKALDRVDERKRALDSFAENDLLKALVEERTEELRETQDVTILCLAGLAETRDPHTGAHLQRTRRYVKALAEQLRDHPRFKHYLNEDTIQMLYKSTPLHDIGKVGVRDAILLKADALTDEEFEEMKRHTIYGAEALRGAEERLGFDSFLTPARRIALEHHEKWDGTGYPQGLRGDGISIDARLMALADIYDALTTKRPYKEGWPHDVARDHIVDGRGTHLDPDVVDAFLELEEQFRHTCQRFQDDGQA